MVWTTEHEIKAEIATRLLQPRFIVLLNLKICCIQRSTFSGMKIENLLHEKRRVC